MLSVCSAAKPKVASYPFTTIDPVLGVMDHWDKTFVMVEIPGLVEGAHRGIGLGHQFLRHADRTRVLWHIVDGTSLGILENICQINYELRMFSSSLAEKPQILVVNKMDITEAREMVERSRKELEHLKLPTFYISAATGQGLDPLIAETFKLLETVSREKPELSENPIPRVVPPIKSTRPEVRKEGDVFVVDSSRGERLLARANLRDWRVRLQLWRELERMGIADALEREGVKVGDIVRFGKVDMEWE